MKRLPLAKLAAAILAGTVVISAIMLPIRWNGQQASTAAPEIDRLLDFTIVVSAFVFSLVCVMLGYALIKFRVKPGDESDGEPIHGNTRLEVAWTLIPTVIVLAGAAYSWIVLDNIEKRDQNPIKIQAYAQQFAWSFGFPGKGNAFTEGEVHVPLGRQIEFKLHSLDVIHSFWVPEWRVKKDAVPGITTTAVVTPNKPGTYQLVCTELCGYGHAAMRATVVVEPPAEFRKWVEGLDREVPDAFSEMFFGDQESQAAESGGA